MSSLFFQSALTSEISLFFEKILKTAYSDFTDLSISEFLRLFLNNVGIDYLQDSYVQFFLDELNTFKLKKSKEVLRRFYSF